MAEYSPVRMKVWGNSACFTRPEFKVERVSYDVMTPSAARGLFEAVFWKPEFAWQILAIHVLKPIRYASLVRNEVNQKMSGEPFEASAARAQRHSLILRDVAYVVEAQVRVKPTVTEDAAKYRDQFRRRLKSGQCFHRPYFGCREFAADFSEAAQSDVALADEEYRDRDLGRMLHDLVFTPRGDDRRDCLSTPHYFDAKLRDGVLHVPPLVTQSYKEEVTL